MKIGVDLRSLENGAQNRGIGRFATRLIENLSKIDDRNQYIFFTSSRRAKLPIFELSDRFKSSPAHGKASIARNIKYIRIAFIGPKPLSIDRFKLDVFLHLDSFQPIKYKKTPVVSILYDLIPFLDNYKDIYQYVHLASNNIGHRIGHRRAKQRWKQMETSVHDYEKAARVISISEHSKRDLIKFIPTISADKIITIPLAADITISQSVMADDKIKKLGLKNFLFYIGGADPRKGLVALVKDMENVWASHPDTMLVLAGKEITDPKVPEAVRLKEAIEASKRPQQVIRFGFVSDDELAWLYKNALAFVFPSSYEGFGLPVLEAMQAGCPVIAYYNSSIPEVAGDAAFLVKDGEPISPAINKLISSHALRNDMINKGLQQAQKFTWEKTARAALKVLEEAAK